MVVHFLKKITYIGLPSIISCLIHTTATITPVFDSLTKIEKYAQSVIEYPNPDNSDWENPDFSTYFTSLHSQKFYKKLTSLGSIKSLWTTQDFKSLLEQVITMRGYSGYQGRFVMKITPTPGTRIAIFGEMHSAFHSLVRDLQALKKIGYIDEHLKITEPDCFILFNGNISSRAAYALETFTIILRLMCVNPDKVLFILGSHEDHERWTNYALKNELRSRFSGIIENKDSLNDLVTKFFSTLPLALYLIATQTTNSIDLVRISNYGTETKEVSEKEFADFFTAPDNTIGFIEEGSRKKSPVDINLKAIIRGEQFYKSQYIPSTGLQWSGKEEGATSWIITSSPTKAYQVLFQFFYDAFVILTTCSGLDEWTLTLFNRDIRTTAPIKPVKTFKLVSGIQLNQKEIIQSQIKTYNERITYLQNKISLIDNSLKHTTLPKLPSIKKIDATIQGTQTNLQTQPLSESYDTDIPMGKDPNIITIGTLLPLSSNVKNESESIAQAIQAVFDKQNKEGGIAHKKLNLVIKDTRYSPEYSRNGAKQLLFEDNTGIILAAMSTITIEACLELLEKNLLLALFPAASGQTGIRRADLKSIFFMRASTVQEGYILAHYAIKTLKSQNIAFFYENDTFGKDTLQGAMQALKELGINNSLSVAYEPNNLNIDEQVKIIQKSKADTLCCFGTEAIVKELFTQLGTKWLANKRLLGSMDLSSQSFRKYCTRNALPFINTSVVPDPEKSDLEIVKEYRQAFEKNQPANDVHCLEAFIAADFFVHILKQIDQPITGKKIITYLEHVKNYNYKGLELNFNPATRQLLHTLWLNKGTGDWEKISTTSSTTS